MRSNSSCKGQPNDWVNTELLPNATIPPGCPHQIKNRTATKWLHDLGFRPQSHKKAFILTDMNAVMWLNIAPCTCGNWMF